jgi:hypothetical protein
MLRNVTIKADPCLLVPVHAGLWGSEEPIDRASPETWLSDKGRGKTVDAEGRNSLNLKFRKGEVVKNLVTIPSEPDPMKMLVTL